MWQYLGYFSGRSFCTIVEVNVIDVKKGILSRILFPIMAHLLFSVNYVPFSSKCDHRSYFDNRSALFINSILPWCTSISSTSLKKMEYSQKTCHPKRWNTEFLKYRNFKDQTPYVRLKSDIQSVFGGIENFMQDLEESLPSDQVEAVLQFCRGVSSDDLRPGVPAAGRYRRAWLDDRKYSPIRDRGICRRYTRNPLTPSQLYQILQARVRNAPCSKLREAEMRS